MRAKTEFHRTEFWSNFHQGRPEYDSVDAAKLGWIFLMPVSFESILKRDIDADSIAAGGDGRYRTGAQLTKDILVPATRNQADKGGNLLYRIVDLAAVSSVDSDQIHETCIERLGREFWTIDFQAVLFDDEPDECVDCLLYWQKISFPIIVIAQYQHSVTTKLFDLVNNER